jgi:hypothetical protein
LSRRTPRRREPLDQRRQVKDYDLDDNVIRDLSILLGVVASAFIVIGVMAYAFTEPNSTINASNNPPAATAKAPPSAPPSTTGQGGTP